MNRWKMHKLGFVNFWLYDREEFPLQNGHILLRGANASGKSITTQSFIPFLLDGDRRPERLDPFGSRDRKMDFYLLGDGETEEATGYLYLEFKKESLEEYLTIGIGMRAQRGKGIDFWGFCLCDGRRIGEGENNLLLYEKTGGHLLSLSKQKMKNRIGDPNNWAESPGVYKQLVNDRVFQFRDIRQYDQLVQLLIKVRTPKLSKDAFRPTEVKRILNDSLQVLTDEDLSAMISTMERMDALEDTLKSLRKALQESGIIRREYNRYNQYILGSKGRAYLEARDLTRQLAGQCGAEEKRRAALAHTLELQTDRAEQSAIRLRQARAQRAAMGEDDLSAKRDRLVQELENSARFQTLLEDGEARLKLLLDGSAERECKLRELARKEEDVRTAIRLTLQELEDQNEILGLGDTHESYLSKWRVDGGSADPKPVRAALRRRREQVDEMLRLIEEAARAGKRYDAACEALDRADAAANFAKGQLRDAALLEQEERDKLQNRFTLWQSGNARLWVPGETLLAIRREIAAYRTPADWGRIRNLADRCALDCESRLLQEQVLAARRLAELQEQEQRCKDALAHLQRQPEPVPPQRERVRATRDRLQKQGIPCAAFYETVEFATGLSPEAQDLLEAQLADAGLLDALVVPPEHREDIREILRESPDCFLLPGEPVPAPLDRLVAAGAFGEAAAACLRSISREDLSAQTALLPDGRFRCGVLHGHSHAAEPAGYVGAAARHANRERQLRQLQAELDALAAQVQDAQKAVSRNAADLETLREERERMPTAEELDQAQAMLAQFRQASEQADAERDRLRTLEREAKREHSQLEQECRSRSIGLPYARTIPAYEEARAAANDYQSTLETLEQHRPELRYVARAVQDTENDLAERRGQEADLRRTNANAQAALAVSRAGAAEIQAFLDLPENQERSRRLAELAQEITRQDDANRDAEKQCVSLREQLKASADALERYRQSLQEAEANERETAAYFSEDLALGFSGLDPEQGLEACAREAAARVPAADRGRTPDQLREALWNSYQQHNDSLLQYRPEMKTIFDAPAKPALLRQRTCITLKMNDKELSLYDFMQTLQAEVDTTALVLEERDRELFEDILTETISHKLRARIEESRQWTKSMTALMSTLSTSMGLTFSLDWKPKKADGEGELDTARLVELLNKDRVLLNREDSQKVSGHFRAKVKRAREDAQLHDLTVNYADLIRTVLDYRGWYEFQMYYQRSGEVKKELTDRVFNKFSGGEKAMAMYVPLFASVSAQYQKGGEACPQLLALDEAFAGVDDQNISAMFELVRILGFDYIMNSQALWGCYSCVEDLDIAELHRPSNARVVTILRYRWNGARRVLEEDGA